MITVQKGGSKLVVTKATFENQLKPLGYQLASEENKGAAKKVAPFENKKEEAEIKETKENEEDKEVKEEAEKLGFKKKGK